MQTSIDSLIPVYVHRDLFPLDGVTIFGFNALQVGPDHVVLFSRRNPLRELATVIRILFPARFFLALAANLDLHSVNRMIVWTPHCAEDQSVRLFMYVLRGRQITRGGSTESKDCRYAQPSRNSRGTAEVERRGLARKRAFPRADHRLRLPLPRLPRTSPRPLA